MRDHIWRASVRSEKMCARVRAVRCSLYTHRRVHGSCRCVDANLPERTKKIREVCKTTNGGWTQVNLTMAETLSR